MAIIRVDTQGGGGGGGITDVLTHRLFYVDAVDGDNLSAQPNSLVFKYKTIQAACTAAAAAATVNTLVVVFPNSYTENVTMGGGVNVLLMDGVTVVGKFTIDNSTNVLPNNIYGNGVIDEHNAGNSAIVIDGTTDTYIYARNVFGGTGGSGHSIRKQGTGRCYVYLREATVMSNGDYAIHHSNGELYLEIDTLRPYTVAGTANGLVRVNSGADKFDMRVKNLLGFSTASTKSAISIRGGCPCNIYFDYCEGRILLDAATNDINIKGLNANGKILVGNGMNAIHVFGANPSSVTIAGINMHVVLGDATNYCVGVGAGVLATSITLNQYNAANCTLAPTVFYNGSGTLVIDPLMNDK